MVALVCWESGNAPALGRSEWHKACGIRHGLIHLEAKVVAHSEWRERERTLLGVAGPMLTWFPLPHHLGTHGMSNVMQRATPGTAFRMSSFDTKWASTGEIHVEHLWLGDIGVRNGLDTCPQHNSGWRQPNNWALNTLERPVSIGGNAPHRNRWNMTCARRRGIDAHDQSNARGTEGLVQ